MRTVRFAALATFMLIFCSGPAFVSGSARAAAGGLPSANDQPIRPLPSPAAVPPARAALGRALFTDPALSGSRSLSCASCHDLATNGASPRRFDNGSDGHRLAVNTPSVFNSALNWRLGWRGSARSLEAQADVSLRSPQLMGADPDGVVGRLQASRTYRRGFHKAFGRGPDWAGVLGAIVAFEQTLLTPDSRFDLWLAGDRAALTPREAAGYTIFKSIGCTACHQGANVGGNLLERHGVVDPAGEPSRDLFRVPSLRNVATTPPYFHDGSAATLTDAVHRMGQAQLGRDLSPDDVGAIVAFLGTLTGRHDGRALRAPS